VEATNIIPCIILQINEGRLHHCLGRWCHCIDEFSGIAAGSVTLSLSLCHRYFKVSRLAHTW